ncbi:hypothetical protein G9A89_000211 [Geosiphon pyriformis]|nr:hypothetical protein G9A89_000211 [Geosiphon pyriformis]
MYFGATPCIDLCVSIIGLSRHIQHATRVGKGVQRNLVESHKPWESLSMPQLLISMAKSYIRGRGWAGGKTTKPTGPGHRLPPNPTTNICVWYRNQELAEHAESESYQSTGPQAHKDLCTGRDRESPLLGIRALDNFSVNSPTEAIVPCYTRSVDQVVGSFLKGPMDLRAALYACIRIFS